MILSDRQKQDIINKLKSTDRDTLVNMINNIDLNSVNRDKIENIFKDIDAKTIMNKFGM